MHFFRHISAIKAITFDLDDTLYNNRPVIKKLDIEFYQWFSHHYPVSRTRDIHWWLQVKRTLLRDHPELAHDVTLWRYRQIEMGLKLLGYNDQKATIAAEVAITEVLRLRNQIQISKSTHDVLSKLSNTLPLVAISNGNADPHKIGLSSYFQLILRAGPDGRAKPYPDMFDTACHHLGFDAYSILHVGDHGQTDVLGARNYGMCSCWFNDQNRNTRTDIKLSVLPDVEISHLRELLTLIH